LRPTYPNIDEWWEAARIEPGKNFGDVDAPFKLKIWGEGSIETDNGSITWKFDDNNIVATLDTKTGVVKTNTGVIMNKYVNGNLTMKIPVGATSKDITIVNGDKPIYTRLYF
jgi:hypothetical protein